MKITHFILLGAGLLNIGFVSATEPATSSSSGYDGKQIYEHWCAICHADAPRMPGTASLAANMKASCQQHWKIVQICLRTYKAFRS